MQPRPQGQAELIANSDHLEQVVQEGIAQAKVSVDIMTADFKAMLVPQGGRKRKALSIIRVFRKLADRGVEIRLMHAGVPSGPAIEELREELPATLRIRRCPRLHAKAVIVDCKRMYLGSANLTGAGLGAKSVANRNFEMGLWTSSPELIDAVRAQFDALWEGHRCEGCGRQDVCPVPLEEPDLS